MEDDKGLELSLGLPCGGSTSASKEKSCNSADAMTDNDERTSKILNDFRNFLNAGVPQSLQRTEPVKSQENFLNNFQTAAGRTDSASGAGVGDNKRKSTFEETSSQKKQETESRNSDIQDKDRISHISITTDEGSTGDNEDVAESEAEGSTSRVVSHHDDGSRTPGGSASSSQSHKEINGKSNVVASSFPIQTMSTSNVPFSITIIESLTTTPSTSSHPLSGMIHNIPPLDGAHPVPHTASAGSGPMPFRYTTVQIPDKDNHWGVPSRPPPLYSPYPGRIMSTSGSMQGINPKSSELARPDVHPPELLKGSSSQLEDDAKAHSNSFPSEYPSIRPGIAAEVKFDGSGSFPNLPWVSTTGPGANGKTISGVTYKFNATQIKIVCACHGIHLSPEEFVRHATEEQSSVVMSTGIPSLRSNNPTTSTTS